VTSLFNYVLRQF